jgi:molecular chaperone GrpE
MNDRTNGAPKRGHEPEPTASPKPAASGSRAQERIAALDTSGAATTARVDELEAQLAVALARAEEAEAGWQRARADFANLRRRTEEERADLAASASDRLLLRVLELADDFDLAVEHVPDEARSSAWVEGIRAIDRKLRALLESEGVRPMGSEGEPFDPHTQQAISYEDHADLPDGTVVKVLQRGYTLRERVLRPALVAVARNDENDDTEPHNE